MSQWNYVTELLMFEPTKAFQEDPSIIEPAARLVLTADGIHQPSYYGKQLVDPSTGYIFGEWESYEAHEKVLGSDLFPKVKAALVGTSFVSWDTAKMYHAILSNKPVALDQPVTEVTLLTLRAPENRNAVVEILTKISERLGKSFVFGVTHEDDQKYMVLCGWESLEEHRRAILNPESAAIFERLRSLVDKDRSNHTHLVQVYLTD